MKWIGITGSRKINERIERDVRFTVRKSMEAGNSLVAGGALGVDWVALDEALKIDPEALRIKIYIPTTLDMYAAYYRKKASEDAITGAEVESLIQQLENLKKINPEALRESTHNSAVNTESYHERNGFIVRDANELLAFQVNNSQGTQDTVERAKIKEIPIQLFTYTIT